MASQALTTIKISWNDDCRRFQMAEPSFDRLESTLLELWPDLAAPYTIKYADEDKEMVTVSSNSELQEAFRVASAQGLKALRLFVTQKTASTPLPVTATLAAPSLTATGPATPGSLAAPVLPFALPASNGDQGTGNHAEETKRLLVSLLSDAKVQAALPTAAQFVLDAVAQAQAQGQQIDPRALVELTVSAVPDLYAHPSVPILLSPQYWPSFAPHLSRLLAALTPQMLVTARAMLPLASSMLPMLLNSYLASAGASTASNANSQPSNPWASPTAASPSPAHPPINPLAALSSLFVQPQGQAGQGMNQPAANPLMGLLQALGQPQTNAGSLGAQGQAPQLGNLLGAFSQFMGPPAPSAASASSSSSAPAAPAIPSNPWASAPSGAPPQHPLMALLSAFNPQQQQQQATSSSAAAKQAPQQAANPWRTVSSPNTSSSASSASVDSSIENKAQGEVVHEGTSCDICGTSPIRGTRYNCQDCGNFDLCAGCEATAHAHPASHVLIKLRTPAAPVPWTRSYSGHGRGRGLHRGRSAVPNWRGSSPASPAAQPSPSSASSSSASSAPSIHTQAHPSDAGNGGGGISDRIKATFIKDLTLCDRTEVEPGQTLIKTWSMQNTGSTDWPEGSKLIFIRGDRELSAAEEFPVEAAPAGKSVEVHAVLVTPEKKGRYTAVYRLAAPDRSFCFGPRLWADVIVSHDSNAPESGADILNVNVDQAAQSA